MDDNIYGIQYRHDKWLKIDIATETISLFGEGEGGYIWSGGVLHSNGYIYCAPHCNNKVLKIKTNYIRDEGKRLLESNASLTEFNRYLNTYQFEYIYVSHKDLYDRIVSYRNNLIFESAKLALERSS